MLLSGAGSWSRLRLDRLHNTGTILLELLFNNWSKAQILFNLGQFSPIFLLHIKKQMSSYDYCLIRTA